jgi:uncharacterized protein YkwD
VHAWHRILRLLLAALAVASAILVAPWPSPLSHTVAHADGTFDSALLSLFNQDRAGRNLPPLQSNATLGSIAEGSTYNGCGFTVTGRAEDMLQRNYFSHTILGCGDQNVFDILRADGIAFNGAAENMGYASGITDPTAAAQWINTHFMDSPDHAANILDPSFNTVGIGSWWTAGGQTWSGTGSAMSDAVVVATEFINAPRPAAAPAPVYHAPPPPARPRPPAPVASTPAPTPAPTPLVLTVAAPAPPPPAPVVSDDVSALGPQQHVTFASADVARVSARAGQSPAQLSTGMTTAATAVVLAALGPLSRRLPRRRLRPNR